MTSEATDIWNVNPIDIMGIDIGRGSGVGWHVKLHGIASKGIASKVIATSSVKEREMAATVLRRGVNVLSRCPHPGVGTCSTPPMLVLASQSTLRALLQKDLLLPSRKMELILGICDGLTMLQSLHRLNLDFQPVKVPRGEDGTPWVADFGLAAFTTRTLGGTGSTSGGTTQPSEVATEAATWFDSKVRDIHK